jgi:hypothetical protein
MGAADKAIWKSVGLFASADELCIVTTLPGVKQTSFGSCSFIPQAPSAPTDPINPPTSDFLPGKASLHRNTVTENHRSGGPLAGTSTGHFPQEKRMSRAQGIKKVWKPNKTKHKLVMGLMLGWRKVCNLSLCALVGRLSYFSLCKCSLSVWITSAWSPLLGYILEVIYISHGWFGFLFRTSEDTQKILEKLWAISGCNLMLKRWWVSFDPTTDYFCFCHLWVLLPGFPLQLWNEKALEAIGNKLGRYISLDEYSLRAPDRRLGKVLVEVDIHSGLLESLEINWRGHTVTQRLDYLGIPFRCTTCRRTRHLRRDCTGVMEEEESEASYLRKSLREDSPGVDSLDTAVCYNVEGVDRPTTTPDTLTGKLKLFVHHFTSHCLLGSGMLWTRLPLWERGTHKTLVLNHHWNMLEHVQLVQLLLLWDRWEHNSRLFQSWKTPEDCREPLTRTWWGHF